MNFFGLARRSVFRKPIKSILLRMRALRKKPKTEHKMWRLSIHELNFVKQEHIIWNYQIIHQNLKKL